MLKSKYIPAFIIVFLLFSCALLAPAYFKLPFQRKKINLSGKDFYVWVASSDKERETGLQNILWLPRGSGMLFIFPEPGIYCFWNKNTFIKLKLVFLREGKVVYSTGLSPVWKGKMTVCPEVPADSVLELIE